MGVACVIQRCLQRLKFFFQLRPELCDQAGDGIGYRSVRGRQVFAQGLVVEFGEQALEPRDRAGAAGAPLALADIQQDLVQAGASLAGFFIGFQGGANSGFLQRGSGQGGPPGLS